MVAIINKPLAIDSNILMFFDNDLKDIHSPHDDALIVKVQISNTLHQQGNTTLHTFNGAPVQFLETMKLMVQAKSYNHLVTFHVMDCPTPHSAILGRTWLHKMKVVPSIYH
ncbi:hypothetical protein ACFX1W_009217 [Malus domestica]